MSKPYHIQFDTGSALVLCGAAVIAAGRLRLEPGQTTEAGCVLGPAARLAARPDVYVLLHMRRGAGFYRSPATDAIVRLAGGDTLLLFPELAHELEVDGREGWELEYLAMSGPSLAVLANGGALAPSRPRYPREHRDLAARLFHEFGDVCGESGDANPLVVNSFALYLFAALNAAARSADPAPFSSHRDVVSRAKAIIADRLDDPPSVEELASDLGMSSRVFRRAFGEHAGVTPKTFIVRRRIQKAMELLASTDMTVGEVADELGFSSPFFMTRQFTQHAGMSPDAWRKSRAQDWVDGAERFSA